MSSSDLTEAISSLSVTSPALTQGDKRLAAIRESFETTTELRHMSSLTRKLIKASLPFIYGEEWETSAERVLKREDSLEPDNYIYCLFETEQEVESVAIDIATAFLVNCRGINITFATKDEATAKQLAISVGNEIHSRTGGLDLTRFLSGLRLQIDYNDDCKSSELYCLSDVPCVLELKPTDLVITFPGSELTKDETACELLIDSKNCVVFELVNTLFL